MFQESVDIIVIGAGHAGIEAAMAVARLGCSVVLATLNLDTIGQMSCNPAVGGPAKSQLVKEVDALGGVMGLCADATYLQMKTLNSSKGPAVRALRAQSDKAAYRDFCRQLVEAEPNLKLRQTHITQLETDPNTGAFTAAVDYLDIRYNAKAIVITTGTFMNGVLWVGEKSVGGGRPGEGPSKGLTGELIRLGMTTGRLKTGTPPRLDGSTIDFSGLDAHPGDAILRHFSFMPDRPVLEQLPCYLTRTNEATHQLIRENLHRSPIYSGKLDGCGPRYCPSIEDKVTRFADKDSHHLFIEPEGRHTHEVYLQGFSTCLPYEIQMAMVHTLPGLEKAELLRPATAVEYDYFPAYQLTPALMMKTTPGVFLAGQICGTSGYEEAACQGLMAGINAARYASGQEPFVLTRDSSYIGTLIDDLVTKEITEPYRMLTSRSEYRLLLRQDNADARLTPVGREIGLVDSERWHHFEAKQAAIAAEIKRLEKTNFEVTEVNKAQLHTLCGETVEYKMPLAQLLRRPAVSYDVLAALDSGCAEFLANNRQAAELLETTLKYEGYIERQALTIRRLSESEKTELPVDVDYLAIQQLSNEAREQLAKLRPTTLGQASRMSGVTPADIAILQVILKKRELTTA